MLAQGSPVPPPAPGLPPVALLAPPAAEFKPPVAEFAPPAVELAPPVVVLAPPRPEFAPPALLLVPPVMLPAPPVATVVPPPLLFVPPVVAPAPPKAPFAPPATVGNVPEPPCDETPPMPLRPPMLEADEPPADCKPPVAGICSGGDVGVPLQPTPKQAATALTKPDLHQVFPVKRSSLRLRSLARRTAPERKNRWLPPSRNRIYIPLNLLPKLASLLVNMQKESYSDVLVGCPPRPPTHPQPRPTAKRPLQLARKLEVHGASIERAKVVFICHTFTAHGRVPIA